MNHRAGGNQNGRLSRSSRGSESSDLVDMKALAAATTRPAPVPSLNDRAPELSGMIGRRDSVVGARIDDRAPLTAGLSWMWLAAGCAAVLIPGLIGVSLLGRGSSEAAQLPRAVPAAVAEAPAAAPPPVEIEPLAHLQAVIADPKPGPAAGSSPNLATAEPQGPIVRGGVPRYYRHRRGRLSAAAMAALAAANAAPGAPAPAGAAPLAPAASAADQAPADSPEPSDKAAEAEPPAEKPKKVAEAAPEEPTGAPPRTVKELRSALARLQNRVVACHQRFQVDGVADVRVAVNPSGTVESASLAGEFEGTPTGDCIVRLLTAASFPSFDGTESVRVSHSFSLE